MSPERRAGSLVAAALSLAAIGCSAAPSAKPPAPRSTASASARPRDEHAAARIEPVTDVGCEIATDGAIDERAELHLFASADDVSAHRRLVTARYESASFLLPPGPVEGAGAGVDSLGWGVSLRALVPAAEVPIWIKPTRRLAGGMLAPSLRTSVRIVRVEHGSVLVHVTKHANVDLDATPIEESVPCADAVASAPSAAYDASGKAVLLAIDEPTELLPSTTSPAGSGLALKAPVLADGRHIPVEAFELRRESGFVDVRIPSPDGTLVGWVPERIVGPDKRPPGPGVLGRVPGFELPSPAAKAPGKLSGWTCKQPLPVAAIASGATEPTWIGEIRAGTSIGASAESEDSEQPKAPPAWTRVRVGGLMPDVLVETSALAECTRTTEE